MGLKIGSVSPTDIYEEVVEEEPEKVCGIPVDEMINVQPEVVIDLDTVKYYRDIIKAREDLEIPEDALVEIENTVFFEKPHDPIIDIPDLLDGLLYEDLNYIIGKDFTISGLTEDLENKNKSKYIIFLASPNVDNTELAAKVIDAAYRFPGRVILSLSRKANKNIFSPEQTSSLIAVGSLLVSKGGRFFRTMEDLTNFINNN